MRRPDFSDKKTIDRHLDRLDTTGVSRRDFMSLLSAGAAAGAMASAFGWPAAAVAAANGKLAYIYFSSRLEYFLTVKQSIEQATEALGWRSLSVDDDFSSERELNNYEQLAATGDLDAVILNGPDGSNLRRIADLAGQQKIWMANVWATLPWFTPFDATDYYTFYSDPDVFTASKEVTNKLLTELRKSHPKGGKVISVSGIHGHTTDGLRSRGRDAALKDFPEFELAGDLPGNFNMEDATKATLDLLTRFPDAIGIYAANDDEAAGAAAAVRTTGAQPGKDILLVSPGDGNPAAAEMIKRGELLATSANSPLYMGAMMAARMYDVVNGWKPRAAERMMNWGSKMMTVENVDPYLARYVNNGDVPPFDYRKMSKVLHPDDWDPQNLMTPLDIDVEWEGIPKPDNYQYPKAYLETKQNGEREAVAAEYKDHYKIDMFGPSPMKKS